MPYGRAGAFLVGSLFSWCVGFVGMRLATTGNLRVAAAAKRQLWRGHAAGLPHRHRHRHVDRRPGPVGRHVHLPDLRRTGLRGPAGLRLRRHAAGLVHACRRRHLYQGGRRRRRPGGQGRGGHSRGRSPQRGHDRRQRGRQRRRLRRHGRRHLRKLRSDHRRGDDPGHGQLRPQGRDLPAVGPRHRRAGLDHQHLHRQGRRRTTPPTRP